MTASTSLPESVAAVRHFTRFYTSKLEVLREGLLDSAFTLTEARVLFELANRPNPTAAELCRDLVLDAGYLSRILKRFEEQGLVSRTRSRQDGRQSALAFTEDGRAAFAPLDERSRRQVGDLLRSLRDGERAQLVAALRAVEKLLSERPENEAAYVLRPHRPGDIGWIVHRHGALYAQEYGFDGTFEALVAEVAAGFIKSFDPKRERCWIAEMDGDVVGSVLLVKQSDEVAKLRLLYVEPKARGLGIGRRFVDECIAFARAAGYAHLALWTNDVLHAARGIYRRAGFTLTTSEPHRSFGQDLVGETWEMAL